MTQRVTSQGETDAWCCQWQMMLPAKEFSIRRPKFGFDVSHICGKCGAVRALDFFSASKTLDDPKPLQFGD